jgi:hypothetical protein
MSEAKPVESPPPINKAVQSPVTFSQSEIRWFGLCSLLDSRQLWSASFLYEKTPCCNQAHYNGYFDSVMLLLHWLFWSSCDDDLDDCGSLLYFWVG